MNSFSRITINYPSSFGGDQCFYLLYKIYFFMESSNIEISTNDDKNKSMRKFIIYSYVIFWAFLAIIGLSMSLNIPEIITDIIINISAWSSTIALIIIFKKISPDISFWDYIKNTLTRKVNKKDFIISFGIQATILGLAILLYIIFNEQGLQSLAFLPTSLIFLNILINLTSGPLGEELGWREYALNKFQIKYSPLKSSLIIGIIWGFWHFPLWLLSGYTGVDLLLYIMGFVVGISATSVIITFFYNKSKNLTIAISIHFWFNYLLGIFAISSGMFLDLFLFVVLFYLITTIILVILNWEEMTKVNDTTT